MKKLIQFVTDVAHDPRIPSRDKATLLVLAGLIVSPVDLIPDWIPFVGLLDDFLMIALVLDYFFNILDDEVLLSSYPWGLKSFIWLRRGARVIAFFAPPFIRRKLWSYVGSPYKKS